MAAEKIMINSIGRNTIIQLLGKGLSTILGLIIVALMTRALGPAGFGNYTAIVAFLQFAAILIDFGLAMTGAQMLGAEKIPANKIVSNLLSFRLVTATVAFLVAPLIAWFLPYSLLVKSGIAITSLAFWASSLTQSLNGLFQSRLKTGWLTVAEIGSRIILLIGTYWAFIQTPDLKNYLLALVLSSLTALIITLTAAHRLARWHLEIDLTVWRQIWRATWPAAVTIALNLVYFKMDTVILSWLKSASEVGLYGAAYKMLEVLLSIPAIIGGLALPLAARACARGDGEKFKQVYRGCFDALLASGLAIIAVCSIVGKNLMSFIAGADFLIAGDILIILSLATAFIFVGNAAGYMIFALGRQKQMIVYYLTAALGALLAYIWFIPRYSVWGAAWVTVGVELFMAIVAWWQLRRFGFNLSGERWGKILLATIVLGLGLMLPFSWLVNLLLASILYLAALWKLNLLPRGTHNN